MKRNASFFALVCLTISMSFSASASTKQNNLMSTITSKFLEKNNFVKTTLTVPEAPTTQTIPNLPEIPLIPNMPKAPSNAPIDNDLLNLYNKHVFKSDHFKFNITVNENWTKPSYDDAYAFANNPEYAITYFINEPLESVIFAGMIAIPPEQQQMMNLDTLFLLTKQSMSQNPEITNISAVKNSSLSGVPFKYVTFDIQSEGVTGKSYIYLGIKDQKLYMIVPINITTANKAEVSKVLKSISIK